MYKKCYYLLILIFISVLLLCGCNDIKVEEEVTMFWGIHDHVSGFEGLPRDPEGEKVNYVDNNTLEVTWKSENSYILPISATAEAELTGIRYYSSGIPGSLEIKWLNPREKVWYCLDNIPEEMILFNVTKENGSISLDFGPPQGAEFSEGMFRVIWFKLTPVDSEDFSLSIYGYQSGNQQKQDKRRVSNILVLEASIK